MSSAAPCLLLCSMLCSLPAVAVAGDWSIFDEKTLFEPPLAHPRSPEMGFRMRLDALDRYEGLLGARVPVVFYDGEELDLQIGMDGGGWIELGREGITFPMLSGDFLIGLPVMLRYGDFSGVISISHISAHLGDANSSRARQRIRYSREFVTVRVARHEYFWGFALRAYVTGGAIFHTLPNDIGREFFGVGAELKSPPIWVLGRAYYAFDLTWNGDTSSLDFGTQLGFYVVPEADDLVNLRIVLAAYFGNDRRGQFMDEHREDFSLAVLVRF